MNSKKTKKQLTKINYSVFHLVVELCCSIGVRGGDLSGKLEGILEKLASWLAELGLECPPVRSLAKLGRVRERSPLRQKRPGGITLGTYWDYRCT